MTADQIRELEITGREDSWSAVATELPRLIADWRRQETEISRLRLQIAVVNSDLDIARGWLLKAQAAAAEVVEER